MFHFGRRTVTNTTPDTRQLRAEGETQHTTGLGISLNDYMDQLMEDLSPAISEKVTLSGCALFEIATIRMTPDRTYAPADEVEQHLSIAADGTIRFRTNTYHNGPGRLGIGRVLSAQIPVPAVQEICRMLDTWFYTRQDTAWEQRSDCGKWYLRVRFDDGREQVQRGITEGAFLLETDISEFIRDRIPIDGLYLFDE